MLLASTGFAQNPPIPPGSDWQIGWDEFFEVLEKTEHSGVVRNSPPWPVGDGGASFGPYQIQKGYYGDATEPGMGGDYTIRQENKNKTEPTDADFMRVATDKPLGKKVVKAWMKRYRGKLKGAKERMDAGRASFQDALDMACHHNGGPGTHYWSRTLVVDTAKKRDWLEKWQGNVRNYRKKYIEYWNVTFPDAEYQLRPAPAGLQPDAKPVARQQQPKTGKVR